MVGSSAMVPFKDFASFHTAILKRRYQSDDLSASNLNDAAIDWSATILCANLEFVGPALWTTLLESGSVSALPHDVREYLHLLHSENRRCNNEIRDQCEAIGVILARAGTQAVLLKGATFLFEAGPARDDRMMRDIDLLIARDEIDMARAALTNAGYFASPTAPAEAGHIHDAPLVHPARMVSVELHQEISTRVRYLSGPEIIADSQAIAPGLRMPSARHRITHNIIHAQIVNGDYSGGVIGFRDLLDLTRLASTHLSQIDWFAMADDARHRGYFQELTGALHKASHFVGSPLPPPFEDDRAGRRHVARCAWQHEFPAIDAALRWFGIAKRALAWERDSYALGLGVDRSIGAHLQVNRRRVERARKAISKILNLKRGLQKLFGKFKDDAIGSKEEKT